MFKIVILYGGLGNQMFGYAFYLHLKKKYNFSLVLPDNIGSDVNHYGYELSKVFPKIIQRSSSFNRRNRKIYSEYFTKNLFHKIAEDNHFYGDFQIKYLRSHYLFEVYDGFWQSEKYFKPVKNKIREIFTFNLTNLNKKSLKYLLEIKRENSVSIHIRRGDYLIHSDNYGNICTLEYYMKAMHYLYKKESNLIFYIFSDDIDWVKDNLKIPTSFIVDCNKGYDSWQDMCLMSHCKHNIIANSSFSWWGAWLNKNPYKIVVAPNKWNNNISMKDVIPVSWVRV